MKYWSLNLDVISFVLFPQASERSYNINISKMAYYTGTLLNRRLRVSLPLITLADLSGNRILLQRVQKVTWMGCDWKISIHFVCLWFFFSKSVGCRRNQDWRQPKTQSFVRVSVLLKVAVPWTSCSYHLIKSSILFKWYADVWLQ